MTELVLHEQIFKIPRGSILGIFRGVLTHREPLYHASPRGFRWEMEMFFQ